MSLTDTADHPGWGISRFECPYCTNKIHCSTDMYQSGWRKGNNEYTECVNRGTVLLSSVQRHLWQQYLPQGFQASPVCPSHSVKIKMSAEHGWKSYWKVKLKYSEKKFVYKKYHTNWQGNRTRDPSVRRRRLTAYVMPKWYLKIQFMPHSFQLSNQLVNCVQRNAIQSHHRWDGRGFQEKLWHKRTKLLKIPRRAQIYLEISPGIFCLYVSTAGVISVCYQLPLPSVFILTGGGSSGYAKLL